MDPAWGLEPPSPLPPCSPLEPPKISYYVDEEKEEENEDEEEEEGGNSYLLPNRGSTTECAHVCNASGCVCTL